MVMKANSCVRDIWQNLKPPKNQNSINLAFKRGLKTLLIANYLEMQLNVARQDKIH
jgi:hypothetical protein